VRWHALGLGWLLAAASLAGVSAPAPAQTTSVEQSETELKSPPAGGDETGVSMEFLEFLGEWEAGNGEWIDPAEVQSADWPVLSNDPADANDNVPRNPSIRSNDRRDKRTPKSAGAPKKHNKSKTRVPKAVDGDCGAASGIGASPPLS